MNTQENSQKGHIVPDRLERLHALKSATVYEAQGVKAPGMRARSRSSRIRALLVWRPQPTPVLRTHYALLKAKSDAR
ncbi:hypothetical protein R69608_07704 [Paraburkholderia nemoris]|nr:hypothetical protein R69749_07994 [Paraburkholderia domus]CAE6971919.1 hypothetical protein R69608_07704 [Paraburkholderia nemoris]